MSDYFLGEIRAFAFGLVPQDWLPCEGQILQVQQYTALFSLIRNEFGGDGQKTFALPDLRGRVIVGYGRYTDTDGQIYTYSYGNAGGAETVALTSAQIPAHNHYLMGSTAAGNTGNPNANYISSWGTSTPVPQSQNLYAAPGTVVPLNPGSLEATGGGQGHSNVQPFLAINYCIATVGIYPARN
ncbi:MAG: tail fiber protein [Methylobacter sp.]|uniref:phage tail protein n=1 Tax=Methylobacter sp. TaxID=2051955 RepID=UPI002731DC37|nr:tail fiber protein [Methylobacter sp.]MDP1663583.1 tail fiber protein [Methylobacter sp.]